MKPAHRRILFFGGLIVLMLALIGFGLHRQDRQGDRAYQLLRDTVLAADSAIAEAKHQPVPPTNAQLAEVRSRFRGVEMVEAAIQGVRVLEVEVRAAIRESPEGALAAKMAAEVTALTGMPKSQLASPVALKLSTDYSHDLVAYDKQKADNKALYDALAKVRAAQTELAALRQPDK